jgi:hypothetical protein
MSATSVSTTPTSVEPAATSAVEPTAAVESTTATMKSTVATEPTASVETRRTAGKASTVKAPVADEAAAPEPSVITVKISSKAATPTTPTPGSSPAIPRAGADENSARKPIRPVVAVRRAGVGRVIIVAVLAYRRGPNVAGTKTHAHADLRLRISQRQHYQNP